MTEEPFNLLPVQSMLWIYVDIDYHPCLSQILKEIHMLIQTLSTDREDGRGTQLEDWRIEEKVPTILKGLTRMNLQITMLP